MSDQAWEQLVDLVDQKYSIAKHKKFTEDIPGKQKLERIHDEIIFEKAGDKFKVIRISSPAVISTKTRYAHRGTAQQVEHEYDPAELVHRVEFYKQTGADAWHEISPEELA
jgi:hypothetical protein